MSELSKPQGFRPTDAGPVAPQTTRAVRQPAAEPSPQHSRKPQMLLVTLGGFVELPGSTTPMMPSVLSATHRSPLASHWRVAATQYECLATQTGHWSPPSCWPCGLSWRSVRVAWFLWPPTDCTLLPSHKTRYGTDQKPDSHDNRPDPLKNVARFRPPLFLPTKMAQEQRMVEGMRMLWCPEQVCRQNHRESSEDAAEGYPSQDLRQYLPP